MTRRIIFLNLVLLSLSVWLGVRLYRNWNSYWSGHDVASLKPLSEPEPLKYVESIREGAKPVETAEIGPRNPFSFDRNDTPLMKPVVQAAAARPKPLLFGTLALGADRIAMLGPGDSRDRRFKPVKTGEAIDGWTVVDILAKSVVIENSGKRETVIMNDPTAQPLRDYSRTLAATPIVTIQNGVNDASRTGAPSTTPGTGTPAPPPTPPGAPCTNRVIQTPFGNKVVCEPK